MRELIKITKVLPVLHKTTQATPFDKKPARSFCIGQYVGTDGLNTFFMTKLADTEEDLPQVEEGRWYNVQLRMEVREYTDANRQTRYYQQIVLERAAEIDNNMLNKKN